MSSMETITTRRGSTVTAWNITLWVLQVLITAIFLLSGGTKVVGVPQIVALFDQIGFGQWFRYFTGGLEIIGAVAVLIPQYVAHGALLLAAVMVGAVLTHLFLVPGSPLAALALLVICAFIAWGRRDRLSLRP
jgi:putative oxidoreductase